jgi:hypothetical protein
MLAGVVAAGLGVALLYASWRTRVQRKAVTLWSAWLLIAASLVLWRLATGPEFGPVIALLVLPMIAWLFVAANRHVRSNSGRQQEPAPLNLPRLRALGRHTAIFLVSVPLAACASTLLVLGGTLYLPWQEIDRLALAVVLIPFVWGLCSFWAAADPRLSRPALGLAVGGSLGGLLLFL